MSIPNPDARHVDYRARPLCDVTYESATQSGLDPFIASLLARRVRGFEGELAEWLAPTLRALPDPATLPDASVAAERLATAVIEGECIGLCTDYDVDGITAHTLVRDALIHRFGHPAALVRPYIGHRLNDGYGLSDNVCRRILDDQPCPAVIVTADCGTSDGPRIERLAAAGIDVIVTDHHGVPDAGIPAAALATVNPSRADSAFADPAIAGCAVAWFLMAQVRRVLVERGHLPANAPKLADSLDLVALGTVADAVSLFSPTNRVLVTSGLSVLNARRRPCWSALAGLLNRTVFDVEDLGFQIGPRINARGRVADPMAALRFLAALDVATAREALAVLDEDNRSRREIERRMVTTACRIAADQLSDDTQVVCVYHDEFHPGVQGIVASRLLDRFGRVTAVLSPAVASDTVSGSLRSVDGVDIGAALRALAGRYPDILRRHGGHPKAAGVTLAREQLEPFRAALAEEVRTQLGERRHGGHPKAAGVTLAREQLEPFRAALAEEVRTQLGERRLRPVLWHDGVLGAPDRAVKTIDAMAALTPYGRGFEAPQFVGEFDVSRVRAVGADPVHLSLSLIDGAQKLRAIWFRALQNAGDPWPIAQGDRIECVYRLTRDTYRGGDAVQLTVENARTKDANS